METKQQIIDIISNLPDDVLEDLLQYLKEMEHSSNEKMHLSLNLGKILIDNEKHLKELSVIYLSHKHSENLF